MVRILRSTARRAAAREGQAMVETALIIPFFLLLLFGIVGFGLAFARYQLISNAAREGARVATLFRGNCDTGQVTTEVGTAVRQFANRLGVAPGDLQFTATGINLGGGTQNDLCNADTINVEVSYRNDFGVLDGLLSRSLSGFTLRSATTMTNERRAIPGATP